MMLFQLARSGHSNAPEALLLLAPRVVAPLTVVGKPVIAEIVSTQGLKDDSGKLIAVREMRSRFMRNARGDTRIDYLLPDQRDAASAATAKSESRYEVVQVQMIEPPISAFAIPNGFTQKPH